MLRPKKFPTNTSFPALNYPKTNTTNYYVSSNNLLYWIQVLKFPAYLLRIKERLNAHFSPLFCVHFLFLFFSLCFFFFFVLPFFISFSTFLFIYLFWCLWKFPLMMSGNFHLLLVFLSTFLFIYFGAYQNFPRWAEIFIV